MPIHRLSELQHKLLEWAIFAPDDVNAFAEVWRQRKRDHSATDHRVMNSVLDAVVQRFLEREEPEQEEFRGQLTAYRNLYAFLSQIIPYQDNDLEELDAFERCTGREDCGSRAYKKGLVNFSLHIERMLDELFINRMEGNEEIFPCVMTDTHFRAAEHEHLASEIFAISRSGMRSSDPRCRVQESFLASLARRSISTNRKRSQLKRISSVQWLESRNLIRRGSQLRRMWSINTASTLV